MSATFPEATEHGDFVEVFPDVFQLRGTMQYPHMGVTFVRNMTVVRRDGHLTVINSIRLSEQGEAALAELGEVKHLVKLGAFHGLDDPYYVHRYSPTFWAPAGSTHKGGIAHDEELVEGGDLPVADAELFVFKTTRLPEAAFLLPAGGGTLITCDAVTNWVDLDGCTNVEPMMTKENGFLRKASVGLPWRKGMQKEVGTSLQLDFQRLLELRFTNLLSAHGPPLLGTAHEDLHETVKFLFGAKA